MHIHRSRIAGHDSKDVKLVNTSNKSLMANPRNIPIWARSSVLQSSPLRVNQSGDAYEQEAELVAEQVMQMSEPRVQRKLSCGNPTRLDGERALCKTTGSTLQRQVQSSVSVANVPSSVHSTILQPGQPLDNATRNYMEARFGYDFRGVRLHTNVSAAQSAADVQAAAYTVGNDIVFGEGYYQPGSARGKHLLAHELTHVVQQRSNSNYLQRQEIPQQFQVSPDQARLIGSYTFSRFALNSSDLTKAHHNHLPTYVAVLHTLLRQYPDGRLMLTGHTDASGDEAYNQTLGQLRADSVKLALVLSGIPAGTISTRSEGETALLISTDQREPVNRRVEAQFNPNVPEAFLPIPDAGQRKTPPDLFDFPENSVPLQGPNSLPPWFWDPNFPRQTERPSTSFNSLLDNAISGVLDPILDKLDLPDWLNEQIRSGARALVDKGLDSALDSALDAGNIQGETRKAIKKSIEALRQQSVRR